MDHALGSASILSGMQTDPATRTAALLVSSSEILQPDLNRGRHTDPIKEQFGAEWQSKVVVVGVPGKASQKLAAAAAELLGIPDRSDLLGRDALQREQDAQ
jgi:hypothetical protein